MTTFTSLSDFPSTYRHECGDLSHLVHYTRLVDRVVSIAAFDDGGFAVCVNNPCYVPDSSAPAPGHDWDSTLTNDTWCDELSEALEAASYFASTDLLSWNPDLRAYEIQALRAS